MAPFGATEIRTMSDQIGGVSVGVSALLQAWARGDLRARDQLTPLVYGELRRRAAAYLRHERPNHTLQPTALVHEAYARLIGQEHVAWQNRAHFDCELLLLDQALTELAAFDPRQARIVELRYFGGLSEQDVAEVLAVSRSTVTRESQTARAWLFQRITRGTPRQQP